LWNYASDVLYFEASRAPNNTDKYQGLSATTKKKGSEGNAHQGCPSAAFDGSGGQSKKPEKKK
jgi:hypothetical protein